MALRFRNRTEAGRRLAERVRSLGLSDPVVLALPRGGVPVGVEVAPALRAPFDVFVARKVGAPDQPEFGIGAVAEGDAVIANAVAVRALALSPEAFDRLVARERDEVARRVARYRSDRALPDLSGRDVVLVDDGLATGVTAEAALHALRALGPRRLVLAVPVSAPETATRLAALAEVACIECPEWFRAVGQCYEDFAQTSDDEVLALLYRAGSTGSDSKASTANTHSCTR